MKTLNEIEIEYISKSTRNTVFTHQTLEDAFNEINNLPGCCETLLEFIAETEQFLPFTYTFARYELDYIPPWIDDELLEYSLFGVKSIKI